MILAGLEGIDATFTEFVNSVEVTIRDGRVLDVRQKANRAALAAVTGAYQTALISFFIGKDFFPALMKVSTTSTPTDECALLGLKCDDGQANF